MDVPRIIFAFCGVYDEDGKFSTAGRTAGRIFIVGSSTFIIGAEGFVNVVTCAGTETFCVEVVEVAENVLVCVDVEVLTGAMSVCVDIEVLTGAMAV